MAEFHFLRPWWLLALPVGIALVFFVFRMQASGGAWRTVVDRALQPLVLTDADRYSGRRWPLVAAVAAWTVATIALAGPAWERLPVPAFRSNEALVVALDLSRSMDAADLAPSRITRAKLKLLSLLERRAGGQTGLVVFSANAFTVTPLTTDTRTIASLVAALSTDIMPSRGTRIQAGLEKSAALLRQANVTDGRILLMTDAQPSTRDLEVARELRSQGIELNVLGVGTDDGAPIPERDGGFLTDGRGNVVVPRMDSRRLAALAESGGGRFSTLTADDADLERVEPPQEAGDVVQSEDETQIADVWRDAGLAFTVVLLPLIALGFRRGWVALLLCCLLLPLPEASAQTPGSARAVQADEGGTALGDLWRSLWRRPDQRGAFAMAEDRPDQAARLFYDPQWRAAAQYRAGEFEASAASLGTLDTADAHYNRGTALARAGELQAAVAAYDRALELEPEHEDARFNRDLLEELLEQNEPPPPQQASSGDQQESEQGEGESSEESQSAQSSQDGETGEDSSEQAQSASEGQPSDGEPGGDEERQDLASADADRQQQEEGDGREAEAEPEDVEAQQAEADGEAASSEELERWASDQAAEQWLRRIRQDPGGLLRRKFLYQYQRLGIDQDGNYTWPGDETEPW